jgi:hypothetical protein
VLKVEGKVLAVRAGGSVGGPAGMLESFDEGRTFQARDMRNVTGMILDIHFIDANVGFIAGASEAQEEKAHARILKTTDGGKTWRAVFDSDRPGDNNWLTFPSATVGYGTIISYQAPAGEARGYVVKTVDGGDHWRRMTVTDDTRYSVGALRHQFSRRNARMGRGIDRLETRDLGQSWVRAMMGLSANKIRFVKRPDGAVSAKVSTGSTFRLRPTLTADSAPRPFASLSERVFSRGEPNFRQTIVMFNGREMIMRISTLALVTVLACSSACAYAQNGMSSGRGATSGDPAASSATPGASPTTGTAMKPSVSGSGTSTSGGSDANGDQGRDKMPDSSQGVRPLDKQNKPDRM